MDFWKAESSSLLSLPLLFSHFPHSSPPPSLFFGDYRTMHLPVETAATRCYDPNTAVWCDDWLREGPRGWGGGGGGDVVQHIHSSTSAEAPLKFKHLYKLEMDPFLFFYPIISPSLPPHLCCHSSFYLISPSSHLLPHLLPFFFPSSYVEFVQKGGGGGGDRT